MAVPWSSPLPCALEQAPRRGRELSLPPQGCREPPGPGAASCCGREGRLEGSQCAAGRRGWLASLGMPRASVSPPVRQGVKPHPFLRWAPLQPLQCSPRPGEGQAGKKKKKAQFYSDLISRAPQVQRLAPHAGTSPIWLTVQVPAGAGWSRLSRPGVSL